jgi:hypothetical protein
VNQLPWKAAKILIMIPHENRINHHDEGISSQFFSTMNVTAPEGACCAADQ